MVPPLHMQPLLILGLLAVFPLVSIASTHRTSHHRYDSVHVDDDGHGFVHKEGKHRSAGYYGKTFIHDDDIVGYGKLAPKNKDDGDIVYDIPMSNIEEQTGKSEKGYRKPKKLAEVEPVSISVEGDVLCQNCTNVGTNSLNDAEPLPGAQVKLVCQKGQSSFYATATTDLQGSFLISVSPFDFTTFTPADDCKAFLVSSPRKECSTVTDINEGKTGSSLLPIPTFAPTSNLMYFVLPFAFAPQLCS